MQQDLDIESDLEPPRSVYVDGGMTRNTLMLRLQADILGIDLKGGWDMLYHVCGPQHYSTC